MIEMPELVLVGLLVEGTWQELPEKVPAAWRTLFAADTGASGFLEASLSIENGVYRQLVGFLAARMSEVPKGMAMVVIPAGRYLKLIHDGPLAGISQGFGQLLAHAKARGQRPTNVKLDFGYLPGLEDGRHELYVALEPATLSLAG